MPLMIPMIKMFSCARAHTHARTRQARWAGPGQLDVVVGTRSNEVPKLIMIMIII